MALSAEFVTVVQLISSVVLALFTVVLAIATWRYYLQAKSQTDEIAVQTAEMTKTRELRYEPRMKAGVRNFYGPNFSLSFVNIGGGIAHDVKAEYFMYEHEDEARVWGKQVVLPEEVYNIGFPIPSGPDHGVSGPTGEIENKLEESGGDDSVVIQFKYKDSAGKEHEVTQKFSIMDKIDDQADSTEFYLGSNERENERPTF